MSGPATATPPLPGDRRAAETEGMYTACLHADAEAVAPLWRLLQREGACTAYQRIAWMGGVLRHLAAARGVEPLFVEVRADGRLIMLLPLALHRSGVFRVIEALDLGVCDYAAPLLARGLDLSPAGIDAIRRAVRDVLPAADLIRITRMPARVATEPNPLSRFPGVRRIDLIRSGFALEGDPATLLKRVCTPSAFKDLARRARRFERFPDAGFVVGQGRDEIDALVEVMIAQRRARFHALGRYEPLDAPGVAAFYREAALAEPEGGIVRVFGLRAEGRWIATAYGLVHGGAFHGTMLTMADGPFRHVAPGLLIASRIMVWAREQGLDYFDFTIGAQPYKSAFRPVEEPLFEWAEAVTLRGRLVLGLSRAAAGAKARLQRHPALSGRLRSGVRLLRRLKGRRAADASEL